MKIDPVSLFNLRRLMRSSASIWLRLLALLLLAFTAETQALLPGYDLRNAPGSAANAPDLLAYGQTALDAFGRTVRTGDLNGDGIADVIVGATGADVGTPIRTDAGAVQVWFGKATLAGIKDTAGVAGAAPDLVIWGASASDQLTSLGALSVADINADGIADLLIGSASGDGAGNARSNCGEAYIVFGRATFPAILDLAIQGGNGADVTIYGPSNDDNITGSGALTAADFNGDGMADLLIGAAFADGPAETRTMGGEAYIVLGRAAFPATLDLSLQGSGGADVTIYGAAASDFLTLGGSLATGDVNGDGLADVLLSAASGDGPAETRNGGGDAYIILGRSVFPTTLNLGLQGDGGADVTIWGASAGDQLAANGSLAAADVDGDGIRDLILGASGGDGPAEGRSGAGEVYVIRGRSVFPATLDLSISGSAGADLTIYGATIGDALTSGGAMAFGDINRDGIKDLLLGAAVADGPLELRTSAGEAYILFGRATWPASLDLAIQGYGGADVTVYGATASDNLCIGRTLAVADVDGNGFADVMLGAPAADGPQELRSSAGEAYIIAGRPALPLIVDLALPVITSGQATLWGATANDQLTVGGALAAGDVNGDGVADIIIGASNGDGPTEARNGAGEIYILYGVPVPELDVAQPITNDLADGGVKSFGNVGIDGRKRLTFTIKNSGSANLTGLDLTMDGADTNLFTLTGTPIPTSIIPGGSTTFTVAFSPDSLGLKQATIRIASNDEDEPLFAITLTGNGVTPVPPLVTTLNAAIIGTAEAVLNASVNALASEREVIFEYGTTLSYGATVAADPAVVDGDTEVPVHVAVAGLLPRTLYHFRVKAFGDLGAAAGEDMTFTTPNRIPVAAADSILLLPGASAALDVLANDTDADGDTLHITSFTTPLPENAGKVQRSGDTLIFTALHNFAGATFTYEIEDGYGGTATGTVTLTLGTCSLNPPTVSLLAAGGTYPVTVTATGAWSVSENLNWVSVSPSSGAGDGVVLITVLPHTSNNTRSKAVTIGGQSHTITQSSPRAVTIGDPLPADLIATYHGIIERQPAVNANLGSRLELTTLSTAACTGKLITGKSSQSFIGTFTPDPLLPQWHVLITLSGIGQQSSRSLALTLEEEQGSLTGSLSDGGANTASASAWHKAANVAAYAAAYAFDLEQPNPDPALPQGSGEGSFSVQASTGASIMTGTLSDDSVFIGSTFVGPQGQVLIYQPLYSYSGSLAGTLTVTPGATVAGNTLSGSPTWFASEAIPASKKTAYRPAFGPIPLSATGGTAPTP